METSIEPLRRGPGRPRSRPIVEPHQSPEPLPELPEGSARIDEPTGPPPVAQPPAASVRFQINQIQRISFPDHTEYVALPGIHDISDERLIKNLTAYATAPGQKRQIFILT